MVDMSKWEIDDIIRQLISSDPDVRKNAAKALGIDMYTNGDAPTPTEMLLRDENTAGLLSWAAKALKSGGVSGGQLQNIIKMLKNEEPLERATAVLVLEKLKDTRAVPALIKTLKDEDVLVRWKAASALGKIKDTRAVTPLIDALKDEEWDVRWYVAESLGVFIPILTGIRLREVEELLRKALGKAEGKETQELLELLEKINKKKNEILEPEAKKLRPPKIPKRKGKPKRRMWSAVR